MDAKIAAMDTPLGTVHATTLGTVAVVQQLGRQATEACALLSIETERGNGCAVLSEVDD